ncbi:ScbR family autoregulator-binding transcription factor [Streptomyces sp. NPDC001339]|uniref:ScbR family autoregulator-binding transcription factor n=1 Tax=Streptomyces sp. NPDC001339 TaxID=3364563 RepID=UPI0036AA1381
MADQARAERTRRALLRTAADAFDRIGYERATLSRISQAAGVTKGALYFHFATKAELALAIQATVCEQFRTAVNELTEHPVPAMQAVIDITHMLARQLRDDPATRASIRLAQECEPAPGWAEVDCYKVWLNALSELLDRAVEDRSFLPQPDNRAIAALLLSLTVGTQLFSRDQADGRAGVTDWLGRTWELILPQIVSTERLPLLRTSVTA